MSDGCGGRTPYAPTLTLKLVRHHTIDSLLAVMFVDRESEEPLTANDVREGTYGGNAIDANGAISDVEMSYDDWTEAIREQQFYGFADKDRAEVHVWVDDFADRADVAYFIGHEIGHTVGVQLADDVAEEDRADTYGAAVAQAFVFMRELETPVLREVPNGA